MAQHVCQGGDLGRAVTVTCRRRWSQKFSISIRGPRKVSPSPIGGRKEDAEEPQKGGQEAGRKRDRKRACDAGEMCGWLYLPAAPSQDSYNTGY